MLLTVKVKLCRGNVPVVVRLSRRKGHQRFLGGEGISKLKVKRKAGSSLQNVEMRVEGSKLVIEIDLTKEFGTTKSGKSVTIAGTNGAISVPDREEVKLNLNVYKPK
jgi:hypothetical protein